MFLFLSNKLYFIFQNHLHHFNTQCIFCWCSSCSTNNIQNATVCCVQLTTLSDDLKKYSTIQAEALEGINKPHRIQNKLKSISGFSFVVHSMHINAVQIIASWELLHLRFGLQSLLEPGDVPLGYCLKNPHANAHVGLPTPISHLPATTCISHESSIILHNQNHVELHRLCY